MTFTLELETEFKVDFDALEVAKSVAECALDLLKCPYEAQVNLLITDNDEIRRINKEYRDIDWSHEYEMAQNGDPNDTQSAV